jgi:HD-GYP domain-containing protein (c-di-GMP phosphodiesterase class II)
LGLETVLRILEDGAGTQWDPQVVGAMVAHQRERVAPVPAGATRTVAA